MRPSNGRQMAIKCACPPRCEAIASCGGRDAGARGKPRGGLRARTIGLLDRHRPLARHRRPHLLSRQRIGLPAVEAHPAEFDERRTLGPVNLAVGAFAAGASIRDWLQEYRATFH